MPFKLLFQRISTFRFHFKEFFLMISTIIYIVGRCKYSFQCLQKVSVILNGYELYQ